MNITGITGGPVDVHHSITHSPRTNNADTIINNARHEQTHIPHRGTPYFTYKKLASLLTVMSRSP